MAHTNLYGDMTIRKLIGLLEGIALVEGDGIMVVTVCSSDSTNQVSVIADPEVRHLSTRGRSLVWLYDPYQSNCPEECSDRKVVYLKAD